MTKKPTLQPQDKYVLRLPDGLRDRIKAYAERNGRSMNAEIVRVLEREFPEPWNVDDRMRQLSSMLAILDGGTEDPHIDRFINDLTETVEGVLTGRVRGVAPAAKAQIKQFWDNFQEQREYDDDDRNPGTMDPEERKTFDVIGRTDKYVAVSKSPSPKSNADDDSDGTL